MLDLIIKGQRSAQCPDPGRRRPGPVLLRELSPTSHLSLGTPDPFSVCPVNTCIEDLCVRHQGAVLRKKHTKFLALINGKLCGGNQTSFIKLSRKQI